MKLYLPLCVLLPPLLLSAGGCIKHKIEAEPIEVKPIRVEPIHITIDVNVRVQEKLNDFFSFEDEVPAAK